VIVCSVCSRTLLAGERYRRFAAPSDGAAGAICSLCEPEAIRHGWTRMKAEPERVGATVPQWTVRLVA
jgi:hypothetical protein